MTNLLVESKKFEVCCCTFSSDDALIAAGYEDGRVLVSSKGCIHNIHKDMTS